MSQNKCHKTNVTKTNATNNITKINFFNKCYSKCQRSNCHKSKCQTSNSIQAIVTQVTFFYNVTTKSNYQKNQLSNTKETHCSNQHLLFAFIMQIITYLKIKAAKMILSLFNFLQLLS